MVCASIPCIAITVAGPGLLLESRREIDRRSDGGEVTNRITPNPADGYLSSYYPHADIEGLSVG